MGESLANADVWTVLRLIVAEFEDDPLSARYPFDQALVDRAIELDRERRIVENMAAVKS